PSQIRPTIAVPLLTLKTHSACHAPYGRDEEYTFNTLLPGALQSSVGPQLAHDFKNLIGRDNPAKKLSQTVRRQLEERPSGLVLPHGMMIQRVQGGRIQRLAWKITRGLFAHERQRFLPERTSRLIRMIGPLDDVELSDPTKFLITRPAHGHTLTCF